MSEDKNFEPLPDDIPGFRRKGVWIMRKAEMIHCLRDMQGSCEICGTIPRKVGGNILLRWRRTNIPPSSTEYGGSKALGSLHINEIYEASKTLGRWLCLACNVSASILHREYSAITFPDSYPL